MHKSRISVVVVIGVMLAVGSAFAQQRQTRADIPFDFVINSKTLPAGQYTVTQVKDTLVLSVESKDGRLHMFVLTRAAESGTIPVQSKLVFHRYGDEYFLSQIWAEGEAMGNSLPVGDREREAARSKPANVSILAKR
jgi:hypothetical protein